MGFRVSITSSKSIYEVICKARQFSINGLNFATKQSSPSSRTILKIKLPWPPKKLKIVLFDRLLAKLSRQTDVLLDRADCNNFPSDFRRVQILHLFNETKSGNESDLAQISSRTIFQPVGKGSIYWYRGPYKFLTLFFYFRLIIFNRLEDLCL